MGRSLPAAWGMHPSDWQPSAAICSPAQCSRAKGGDCCKPPDGFDAAAFTKGNALGVACGYTMLQANTQMLESL